MENNAENTVFQGGYNRRLWDVEEPAYNAIEVNPRDIAIEHAESPTHNMNETKTSEGDRIIPNIINNSLEPVQQVASISAVYDPKNQLASLIKNAHRNKDALKQRNDKIKETKIQHKNRYGW